MPFCFQEIPPNNNQTQRTRIICCITTRLNSPVSPVLLPIGDDGQSIGVVPVAADVRVPPGHTCRCCVILHSNTDQRTEQHTAFSTVGQSNGGRLWRGTRRWCGNSRSGRWRHLSCGLGCRPCWGCWRCPAEGWREERLGSPGCWVYGAGLRLLPWRRCLPSRSDSSLGEPFLEGRADQLHKNATRVTMTQGRHLFFWHKDCCCLGGDEVRVALTQGADDIINTPRTPQVTNLPDLTNK